MLQFTKMQGAGNDYIYIDGFKEKVTDYRKAAIKLSDRHYGIGSDGLVVILPSESCDFRMRMFNADGSESEMCGNASRCVARYVYEKGLTDKTSITLETGAGTIILNLNLKNNLVEDVTVDMGEPVLTPSLIPVVSEKDIILNEEIELADRIWRMTCVSMGNPHTVLFTSNIKDLNLPVIGPLFENHILFPKRINTEFVEIIDSTTLNMRVWERGAGETLACGTGACAVLVASVLNGYTKREVTIHLIGGDLTIRWDETDNHVYMTGPAEFVFDGVTNLLEN
ncbi:MAG: diaminopimelate epimerase [Bacteroidales bacterium]